MNVLGVVKRSPIVFPLACVAAVSMMFISEGSYRQSVGTLDRLQSIQESRSSIQRMAQAILDAESGQRGYLLTNRKEYLLPYAAALRTIDESFRFLDRYYGDDPRSIEVLTRLHALTETKLSELAETLRLFDAGQGDAAKELVLSDIGKEKMEVLRSLGAELLANETQNVAEGRGDLHRTLMLSRVGLAALSAISLFALFLFLRQTSAAEKHQQDLKRIVQGERDRLEIEVGQRTAQLTELTDHLQSAREDERSRLARNLHDDAARIRSRLAGTAPEALERLAHLVETLNSSIALGRKIIEDLHPSTLANLGLVPTLEILARDFSERSGVKVHCALDSVKLDPGAELMAYRLVQEAITNITKYAKASQVWLGLGADDGMVQVTVRDNGVGFDPAVPSRSAYGLVGMRYRVEAEGGTMALVSAPGQGTLIRVRLPESALAAA
jgi:signal transduction histidine kinase